MSFIDDDLTFLFSADAPDTTTATIGAATVYGYFDRPGITLDLDSGRVVTMEPTFSVNAADVTSFNTKTGTIVINSVTYTAKNVLPSQDGRVTVYFLGRD